MSAARANNSVQARWLVLALAVVLVVGGILVATVGSHDDNDDGLRAGPLPDSTPTAPTPMTRLPDVTDYPDEDTTGVPDGVSLRPSESLTVEENGAVIERLEVNGTITVKADDVVIRDSRVVSSSQIPVRNAGRNLVIEDTEIDGGGKANPAVAFSHYTLRRVHIHNVAEGPRIAGGNVTIEDSYIHGLVQVGDNHTDAVQAVSGEEIVLRGNRIEVANPDAGVTGNAAFMFGEDDGALGDCMVEENLLGGGNYTVNGGGSGTDQAECAFRGNVFRRDSRYGPAGNLGPNVTWENSNVWLEDGEPVR